MQFQTTQQSICSVSMLLKHWLHSSWIVHHIDPVVPAFGSNGIVHCFRGFPASVTSIFPGFDQSWCAKPQQLWTKTLQARHKQRIDSYRGPAARFSFKDLEEIPVTKQKLWQQQSRQNGTIFFRMRLTMLCSRNAPAQKYLIHYSENFKNQSSPMELKFRTAR